MIGDVHPINASTAEPSTASQSDEHPINYTAVPDPVPDASGSDEGTGQEGDDDAQ